MKVKQIKSKSDNDCVVSAISTMTKKPYNAVAKTLVGKGKNGLASDWVDKAIWNYNLEFKESPKGSNLTLKQLGEHSKKYKSGVIYGIESLHTKQSHALFIKNGIAYDSSGAKKLEDGMKFKVKGYFVNVKDKK